MMVLFQKLYWTNCINYDGFIPGIVLGTLYLGGYMMSQNELTPGNLMSFMVATQTIQR